MLTDRIKQEIINHYNDCYPYEQVGFIVDDAYVRATNTASGLNVFMVDDLEHLQVMKLGEVKAFVHSHPDGSCDPSDFDRVQMAKNGYDYKWVITNGIDFSVNDPKPFKLPLLGRDYLHGLVDCYTLFKDYYERELGIIMSDYERKDNWWDDPDHEPLYLNNFAKEGFVEVSIDDLQKHDVLLCRVGRTEHINHACIFIGDGKLKSEQTPDIVGNDLILHHPYGRQSVREILGQQWYNRVHTVIRHRGLL